MTVEVKLTFATSEEAVAFLTKTAPIAAPKSPTAATAPAVTAMPTATASAAPAAAETKADKPAKAAAAKTEATTAPAPTTAAVTTAKVPPDVVPYEKTEIPGMIQGFMGKSGSDGYTDRRAKLVDLLAGYSIPTARDLKPEQYAEFIAKFKAMQAPATVAEPEEALG